MPKQVRHVVNLFSSRENVGAVSRKELGEGRESRIEEKKRDAQEDDSSGQMHPQSVTKRPLERVVRVALQPVLSNREADNLDNPADLLRTEGQSVVSFCLS